MFSAREKLRLLRSRLRHIEERAERWASSPAVLLLFTLLYVGATWKIASTKLLWDDEFYTLYISRAGGLSGILEALSTGADQHPPGFYYLTDLVLRIFPLTHVTVRLPSIFGFWLFCICLYYLTRRLANSLWAVVAMLLPLLTTAYYYATEARGYALVLGLISLSLLCWMHLTEGTRRPMLLPLLGLSLAGAVASHYYAILAVSALCTGELVRSVLRRKIDWAVWLSFMGAFLPMAVFASVVFQAKSYSAHFWAIPDFTRFSTFHVGMLGWGPTVLMSALFFALIAGLFPGSKSTVIRTSPPSWWLAAIGGLIALPLVTMIVALAITHGYTERYALSSLIGSIVLLVYFCSRITRPVTALAIIAAILICFAARVPYVLGLYRKSVTDFTEEVAMFRNTGSLPIAISEPSIFHRFSFYAPRDLASRAAYVTDPASSIKYSGFDTVDRGFLDLEKWFPLNMVPRVAFLQANSNFLAYGSLGVWSWLSYEFNTTDLIASLKARHNDFLLFLVHNTQSQSESALALSPDRLILQIPRTGKSLCELYMSSSACPVIPRPRGLSPGR